VSILKLITNVSKIKIHPATEEAAKKVASNLRFEDYRECVEGHGRDPVESLPMAIQHGHCISFDMPNGKTAGLAGIHENGAIWMLCTPDIHDYPIAFAREAKRWIDSRPEPILFNICDARNRMHLRLLQFLGFKFLRKIKHGPNNITFIEFCRLCANPSH